MTGSINVHSGQLEVRVGAGGRPALSAALGQPLPGPNEVTTSGERHVLWLAPDGWLVLGGPAEAAVRAALAGHPCSVVDVSAQRTTLILRGPDAAAVLAHGCALDLDRTPVGRCAQTMVARAPVLLWRAAETEFRLLVRPSYAAYLQTWLNDAGREYGHVPIDPRLVGGHAGRDN